MPNKLCAYNLHDGCLNVADKSNFIGRCCKVCIVNKNQIYYKAKKESLNLIQRAKDRQQKTYVHKRQPKLQQPEE